MSRGTLGSKKDGHSELAKHVGKSLHSEGGNVIEFMTKINMKTLVKNAYAYV